MGADETSGDGAKRRRARYEAVLRTVKMQTTEKQRAGVTQSTITMVLTPTYDIARLVSTIRAAHQHGDLLRWQDEAGLWRYTRMDAGDLRRVAAEIGDQDHPDKSELAKVNQALAEVRDVE